MTTNSQRAFLFIQRALDSFAVRTARLRTPFLIFVSVGSAGALSRAYIFDWGYSSGPSMYPTQPDETHILFTDLRYRWGRGVQIGDVVQAEHPQLPGVLVGKRVLGLPGDYVVRSKAMSASVGGAKVQGITDWVADGEENKKQQAAEEDEDPEPEMIQVPEGHVWLEGDNLAWSRDSRVYGPLPMALVKARSAFLAEGWFRWSSLRPGKGLRKVEEWEVEHVLGEDGREKKRVVEKKMDVTESDQNS